jgi:putative GTP pyrophosphokinase
MKASKIIVHSLTARETKIKSFQSFHAKVLSKNLKEKFFETIEDIAGVRVICLYRSDLERLGKTIQGNFRIVSVDTTRTRTTAPFGYASDDYIVKLPMRFKGTRYDEIKELKCEIQVRTILMDAWASVSHHLAYKQVTDVPTEALADFNALAGLFYVADTHFEMFRQASGSRSAALMKNAREGVLNLEQEINLDTLRAYFALKYPDRFWSDPSKLISELRTFGYWRLSQLDEKIKAASPVLGELEQEEFQGERSKHPKIKWAADGLIRTALDLTDDKYYKTRSPPPPYGTLLKKYRKKL